jgi:hypothetical protein
MFAHHLGRFLLRVLVNMPALRSSNWLAVLVTVVSFSIPQIVAWQKQGWKFKYWQEYFNKPEVNQNLKVGIYTVIVVWSGLFMVSLAIETYKDHMDLVKRVQDLKSQPCKQSACPQQVQVNVPPPTVIVQGAPIAPQDPTGFVQLESIKPSATQHVLALGKQIAFDLTFKNPGPFPLTDSHHLDAMAIADMTRIQERDVVAKWKKNLDDTKLDIRKRHTQGEDFEVGIPFFRPVTSQPLVGDEPDKIMAGATRIYVFSWYRWKDSRNHQAEFNACYWLNKPATADLSAQPMPWSSCTER